MSNNTAPGLRAAAERAADALEKACMQPMAYEVDEAHAAAAALRAALAQPAAQPVHHLTQDDIHTVIGHVIGLQADGLTDMPRYFMGLAERIALARGDEAAAQRVRDLMRERGIGAAPTS